MFTCIVRVLAVSIFLFSVTVKAAVVEVQMTDSRTFLPFTVTINEGDTVQWRNVSSDIHTSTSGNPCNFEGTWDSGFMNPGNTFSRAFPNQGLNPYFCIPHCNNDMFGAVIVQGVGIEEDPKAKTGISQFKLFQNKPNPFFSRTEIQFVLGKSSKVKVEIFNLIGQRITTLAQDLYGAGSHVITWDGRTANGQLAPKGIYFYTIQADGFGATRIMVMLR